ADIGHLLKSPTFRRLPRGLIQLAAHLRRSSRGVNDSCSPVLAALVLGDSASGRCSLERFVSSSSWEVVVSEGSITFVAAEPRSFVSFAAPAVSVGGLTSPCEIPGASPSEPCFSAPSLACTLTSLPGGDAVPAIRW